MSARIVGSTSTSALVNLTAYREADALLHVERAFEADDVPHPDGSVDPVRDVRTVEDELILADLVVAEKRLDRISRDQKKGVGLDLDREAKVLDRCRERLESGQPIRGLDIDATENKILRGFQFLSAKPLLLVLNVDEARVGSEDWKAELAPLEEALNQAGAQAVVVCAKIELEIAQLDANDAEVFLRDLGLDRPGLDRVIQAAYGLLGYISFFTVGKDECRAWSIPTRTVAQQAAGEIHSDIEF